MRDLVLIVSDLYVPERARDVPSTPGLDALARFSKLERLPGDWRAWLARTLGLEGIADLPVAALLAHELPGEGHAAVGQRLPSDAWIATPVHLQVAVDHVRMDGHAVLALDAAEHERLVRDFGSTFAGSGLALRALDDGALLLTGLAAPDVATHDPRRALGGDIAPWLASGRDAPRLRALTSELEMWLHDHAINRARRRERRRPVTGLWLWGGGASKSTRPAAELIATPTVIGLPALFANDAWTRALWRRCGGGQPASGDAFDTGLSVPRESAVAVIDLFGSPDAGGLDTLERRFLAPALVALAEGRIDRFRFVANDTCATLARRDRLRFWRRPRAMFGMTGSSR